MKKERKFCLDYYDKDLLCWRPLGIKFVDKDEAIKHLDEVFVGSGSKISCRVIENIQKVVAQRLIAKPL